MTDEPSDLPLGRRIAYWRGRRAMSQQIFADRLGKSKSWVDKIERGVRKVDRFSVIHDIADVLRVDAALLLGKEPAAGRTTVGATDRVAVDEIRSALERYESIGALPPAPAHGAPTAEELGRIVAETWRHYQHGRYGAVARGLPRLLRDAQILDGGQLLSQVYQAASALLGKVGEHELSWLAADRAVTVSPRGGDPVLAGLAAHRVGAALLALGRVRAALEVSTWAATWLGPSAPPSHPERVAAFGTLLVGGAMAAARGGDVATVRELMSAATRAAASLGQDLDVYGVTFGPTTVDLDRAAVAVELGEGRTAIDLHERIDHDAFAALTPGRRAGHHLTVARAATQLGEASLAASMLLAAERIAPAEIRSRPLAHEVLSDILRRTRRAPPPALADLAEQLGLDRP